MSSSPNDDPNRVLLRTGTHWIVFLKQWLLILFGAALLVVWLWQSLAALGTTPREGLKIRDVALVVGLLALSAGLIWLWLRSMQLGNVRLTLTGKHVHLKRGVIRTLTATTPHQAIHKIAIEQTALGRVLGFGSIKLEAGEGHDPIALDDVAHPRRIESIIKQQGQGGGAH